MPSQNAKFVSAVFAGVLAGANFTPASSNSAHAEDNCLTAPNAQTPHGSHWYYRLEHGTKRHCWYLREESEARPQSQPESQSAAAISSPQPAPVKPAPAPTKPVPTKPAPAKADTATQGSVANARAELPWPQPRTAPETPAPAPAPAAAIAAPPPAAALAAPAGQLPAAAAPTGQLPATAMANAPSGDNTQPSISAAAVGDTDTSQTTIASRWPDQLNASAADDPAPVADNPSTTAQLDTASAPPPAAAPVPLATADAPPSANKQPGSMQGLLTIMIAALALAGLVGGAIMRFSRRKREDGAELDLDRHPVWDPEYDNRPLRYPAAAGHRPNIGRPRELRTVEPDDTIKEMLARLARSAQT